MKYPIESIGHLLLSPLRAYFQEISLDRNDQQGKSPFRSEIFSMDQMVKFARTLAKEHRITYEDSKEQLLKRLSDNADTLLHVNELLKELLKKNNPITPAGEWLLDNYYLIEEQIQLGKRYLPKGYSKGLPKLVDGDFAGLPRVYDIVVKIISHSDGHVDIHMLNNFISAYQRVTELTLGELWAIPIMLRLALLENLRRVATRIAINRMDADLAYQWADKIIETTQQEPANVILTLADMARSNPPLESAFVSEFNQKLQWKGATHSLPLSWLEQRLSENNLTINALVLTENRRQAADQVSITNSINSLRFLAKLDWRDFVEEISLVEQTLREDLNGIYSSMDFFTRDSYRHQVEKIARRSKLSEREVARIAINLAKESAGNEKLNNKRESHVGYFLVGKGKETTEKLAKTKLTPFELLVNSITKYKGALYFLGISIITVLLSLWFIQQSQSIWSQPLLLIFVSFIILISVSHLAISLTNWIASLTVSPLPLPKLNFSKGIPDEARTLVIVPTIISSESQTEKIIEDLEVRYLANKDFNLLFGLLTDLKDSRDQHNTDDTVLETFATNKISDLNERYCEPGNEQFFLFHRPRQWNAREKVWMGYERKRGKLGELNQLLRGRGKDKFSIIVGPEKIYTSAKYVITLDTDTQLPRGAAWKLVGLMEHPLNQPQYDTARKRVTEGYGVLQPRIAISLHGASRSLYSKMYENDIGIDPYTRIVSDIYQDVFHEASFIGKGIYHIDVFESALNERFPENRILSHDLLEGCYLRCGFASDVQLYEEYPSKYSTDISRRHRWIRGDWQIGNWFFPFVPGADRKLKRNSINALSRWKIFDNLRRSMSPVALTTMLLLGWTILNNPVFWTVSVLLIVILPALLNYVLNILKRPEEQWSQHLRNVIKDTSKSITQSLFLFVCLPHESMVSLDAISRSLWRIYISKKNLLQWNPSATVAIHNQTLALTYRSMWASPAVALVVGSYLLATSSYSFFVALPFLVAWISAPAIVFRVSQPFPSFKKAINENQKLYLRELSRTTWGFFESLVTVEDNWLPPDNIQQYPISTIAHRTSPTNIGMSLLANLAAYDFGYITCTQVIKRTSDTFQTLSQLERFEGHFYNWYDTQSLTPLHPKYISTVDSGNMAGHLLTLRQGLLSLADEKIIDIRLKNGIDDLVRIISKSLSPEEQTLLTDFEQHGTAYDSSGLTSVAHFKNYIEGCMEKFNAMRNNLKPDPKSDAFHWIEALEISLQQLTSEINFISPWILLKADATLGKILPEIPTLRDLAFLPDRIHQLRGHSEVIENSEALAWIQNNIESIQQISSFAKERITALDLLAKQCDDFANIRYDFLYDKSHHLLSIGYSVDKFQLDESFYDLLASEARLGAFVGIAQGKIPQESWFALGRRLTTAGNIPTLLSWSGSMFEYLMPLLVMPTYENTLLDETYAGNISKQIQYGKQQDIPWGISESCYNLVDAHLIYQYKAFGVPELGFKRGLDKDLVIAPYATVMALMVDPWVAIENLQRMQKLGYEGRFGFFEAVDYTPSRLPRSKNPVLIQSFMAHHEGMSLLSLDYLLNDQPMQKRFTADARFQTALLLLQERVPKTTTYFNTANGNEEILHVVSEGETRVIKRVNTPIPEIQLLSNGKYHLMITSAGSGYSRWKDLGINRWREDSTRDHWGSYCYIRDVETGAFWSTTYQPTLKKPDQYEAIFSQGRAEFKRSDNGIECYTEIVVSPEDDIEIRRLRLVNHSTSKKVLEITSYTEVVIALPITDVAHPAFSNLFVQTEINEKQHCILCTRRPRSSEETPPWMFQLMKLNNLQADQISFETDRMKFIGRGGSTANPLAMNMKEPLQGTQGSVLDPIASIQYRFTLAPGEKVVIDMVTGIAGTRENTQQLIDKYQDAYLRDRAFDLSWTHSQVVLRQINAPESHAQLYTKLASSIVYNNPSLRAKQEVLLKNHRGQSALWSYSISGDLPIVLLMISETSNIHFAQQLIKARAYWQLKGLTADLVILNEDRGVYRQALLEEIQVLINGVQPSSTPERQGKVFVRSVDQISTEDYILLQTVAKVVISDTHGSLEEQINRLPVKRVTPPALLKTKIAKQIKHHSELPGDILFGNGFGGFSSDGREYLILTDENTQTPLPWVNVIANKDFGTIVSESGPSYTWHENAQMFRLTPWSNDPVTDACGEAYYIRDEDNGIFWSPMPWPVKNPSSYITRHGFGYSLIEHQHDQIRSEVKIFVDTDSSIRFTCIKIRNNSSRKRKLSIAGYIEWILGSTRQQSVMHVVTERDAESGAILARNSYNSDFSSSIGFIHTDEPLYSYTCDRREFIGRNGNLQSPSGLKQLEFTGKTGAGLDPCTAYLIPVELQPGQEREIIFRMGAAKGIDAVRDMLRKFEGSDNVDHSFENVKKFWDHTLGSIQIQTPDVALNILTNGWLLYQILSCRFWGRSGFYQSGGAYGYRDQLQDAIALVHAKPQLTREHIILSASRQFIEGDVQHWWHPPVNKGVRTLCSDDFLWLPYVTSRYINATHDTSILNEIVSFIDGRPLHVHEESYYDLPMVTSVKERLYDHCKLSIQRALTKTGVHGLPLIGSGDWNDGMNMVGIEGKGESIWLGFFLYDVLNRFLPLAKIEGDEIFIKEIEEQTATLKINLNKNGWDGNWYLRAYFDDGTVLGSANGDDCKIDSISQSWSVLSEAGEHDRMESAMKAVDQYLVNRDKSLIQLLDPPFDTSAINPGYIKGYVPGVRENGGQYTHAAIWMVMAFAKMQNHEKTWELLQMINPINHGHAHDIIQTYKVEPYVMAADVYGVVPHVGRGGWTWYTGSAGWMYQLIIESFLGISRQGNVLEIKPCVPQDWQSFKVSYKFENTTYLIEVNQKLGQQPGIFLDNALTTSDKIILLDDEKQHLITIYL